MGRSMSEAEAEEYCKRAREHMKNFTPEDSLRLLQSAGICDEDGDLTKPYRPS